MTFTFSDAWLLQSIFNCENDGAGADLRSIISFCDYTNHAIMSYAEFSLALVKLKNIDMVKQHNYDLFTTQNFKIWHFEMCKDKKRLLVHKELAEIEKYLNESFGKLEVDIKEFDTEIDELDFSKAVNDYISGAK